MANHNWCIANDKHQGLFFHFFFFHSGKRSGAIIARLYAWLNKAISGSRSSKQLYSLCRRSLWSWKEPPTSAESPFVLESSLLWVLFQTCWQALRLGNGADNMSDSSLNLVSGRKLQEIDVRRLLILLCSTGQCDVKASIDSDSGPLEISQLPPVVNVYSKLIPEID